MVLARDAGMTKFGEVVARFELDDAAFAAVRVGLERAFRAYPDFRVTVR